MHCNGWIGSLGRVSRINWAIISQCVVHTACLGCKKWCRWWLHWPACHIGKRLDLDLTSSSSLSIGGRREHICTANPDHASWTSSILGSCGCNHHFGDNEPMVPGALYVMMFGFRPAAVHCSVTILAPNHDYIHVHCSMQHRATQRTLRRDHSEKTQRILREHSLHLHSALMSQDMLSLFLAALAVAYLPLVLLTDFEI